MRVSIQGYGPRGAEWSGDFDQDVIKIGTLPSSHVIVSGDTAARMHAVIETEGHAVRVIDLGSADGTNVNGVRTDKNQTLASGDVLRIGDWTLRVTFGAELAPIRSPESATPVQAWRDAFGRLHDTPEAAAQSTHRLRREIAVDNIVGAFYRGHKISDELRASLKSFLMSPFSDGRVAALAEAITQAKEAGHAMPPPDPITEQDLRVPEFRGVDIADLERREDARKDRWERGIREIAGVVGLDPRKTFEVGDVVKAVRDLADRFVVVPVPGAKP